MPDKYTDEKYLEHADSLFEADESVENETHKIVTTRKEHRCAFADVIDRPHQIAKGQRAIRENAVLPGEGWVSAYSCLPCVDTWIAHLEEGAEFPPENANE